MIDDILKYNEGFVARGDYKPYAAEKFPRLKTAIVSCMDTRLTALLPAALGLRNGDVKMITNAGGMVADNFGDAVRSLLVAVHELGVKEVMVIGHTDCGAAGLDADEMKHEMLHHGVSPEAIEAVRASGVDLDTWLTGFGDVDRGVADSIALLRKHPLFPADIVFRGFVMDTVTGAVREVEC